MQSTALDPKEERHVVLTCLDDRIDDIVEIEIEKIRAQGGRLRAKEIFRPPGGVHSLSGDPDCRAAFYKWLTSCHQIAGTTVFHLWPHTLCQECGLHRAHKLGNGTRSDLWFHADSAKKLLRGGEEHFRHFPAEAERRPRFDVRIVLTLDQRIITIDEADQLLTMVPEDTPRGLPCLTHGHVLGQGNVTHHPPMNLPS